MIKIKSLIPSLLATLSVSFSAACFAALDNNNTLSLTIHNHSLQTLHHLKRSDTSNPGNIISAPDDIKPGEDVRVTITKTEQNDIFAHIIFATSNGEHSVLTILDQEQIHFGQPIFNFSSEQISSTILSKTRNKNVGPRFLTYVAAEMEVSDK